MSFSIHTIQTVGLDLIGQREKQVVYNWPGKLVAAVKPWRGDSYKVPIFELRGDDYVPFALFQQDYVGIRIGSIVYRLYMFYIDERSKNAFLDMLDAWLDAARQERYMELI